MEMPELNEDILEGESNPELLNQAEDSASLDESGAATTDDQLGMEVDPNDSKTEETDNVTKLQQSQEGEDTLDDSDLQKQDEESQENLTQGELSESLEDKNAVEEAEPVVKKAKMDADADEEQVGEHEADAGENQTIDEVKKTETEIKEEKEEGGEVKSEDKTGATPDTDLLSTLASAALEQDPKDKNVGGQTPARPTTVKTESDTPKKKPEVWFNVGVFDTNTTTVTDYIATPETNDYVDLVTATLNGRRIQLEPGTAYKFRVCAVNGCGTGPWSDVAAFKTTLPGFPGAPSAIKISKSPEGAHLTWEPPGGNSGEIVEYAVYLAVRSASQGSQPVTTNQAQLAFVRVFCGPTNKCVVPTASLASAHIDTTTKPAIIFRIAAKNSKGYGPATQVRWLQESQNGTSQGVKRAVKA